MSKLKVDDMIPLYIQLMNDLEKKIRNKVFQPGEKLKTETEIAKEYGVSLITVRNAVSNLIKKGLVVRKQGKGTFVTQPKFSKNINSLQGFSDMCLQMGVTPGAKTLENNLIYPNEKIYKKLKVSLDEQIIYISRLRYADNDPVVIEKNYFPFKFVSLLTEDLNNNSLFHILKEKLNVEVSSSVKKIELCKASKEEAELLNVKKNSPLILIKSIARDLNGEPMYIGVQIINGERFSFYIQEGKNK